MKCPSCGGKLFYNISKQNLECEYCKAQVKIEDYKEKNAAVKEAGETIQVSTYNCRNCGAQLACPPEQMVAYCMYCGGEATLVDKAADMEKPETIIPFKVSKKIVKRLYEDSLAKQPFVPKDFKKADFIEGFRGIYLPYWRTQSDLEEKTKKIDALKHFSKDSYDYTQHYRFEAHIHGKVDAGTYDASSGFDDTIASEIAPFSEAEVKPFNEAYLAGFYADVVTSPLSNFDEPVQKTTVSNIQAELLLASGDLEIKKEDVEDLVTINQVSAKSELHPVWFLTWKNKKRVAYSVMNGETGKVHMDIPVDLKMFFLTSLLLSLGFFAALSILPVFILPTSLCIYTSYLLYITSRIFTKELRTINLRENHVYDYGNTSFQNKKAQKERKKDSCMGVALEVVFAIYFAFILMLCTFSTTPAGVKEAMGSMLILQIFASLKGFSQIRFVKNKMGIIPLIITPAVLYAARMIADNSRQGDGWYYGIAMGLLAGIILNCVFSILYINYLTTRPVPNFYSRQGANNGSK